MPSRGKRKIKTEIPEKKNQKDDVTDTERQKVGNIFTLSRLFTEACRGYGD